ncbi:MAG: thioester domain-containing protein, partial [Clostridia bacterium]|nr:thioester domain-containing protein [Clostridia bacterium]
MKRLISFIICMLMLLSLVPAAVYAEDTENATAYDLPESGDKVNIVCTGKAEEAKIGGSVKNGYYNIHRYGEGYAHTVKFRKLSEDNVKSYDPDIILYCIQFVKLDKSKYEVFKPAKHEYWQGLSETAREGILLSIGLGYPASTLEELSSDSVTVTADDALAATQTLAWEFELGLRTTFEPFTAEEIAAKKDTLFSGNYAGNPNVNGINGTPAETAYNKILER